MKNNLKPYLLPLIAIASGGVGALLRVWLYATGLDQDNLLLSSHPAGYLVLLLSVAVLAALFLLTLRWDGQGKYADHFPPSIIGAVGTFLAAASLLVAAMIDLIQKANTLAILSGIFGTAAAAALVFTGYCRLRGHRPSFIFHILVCLYFLLRLIVQYQSWSSDPQLHDYCFQLLATILLMLFSYHRSALDLKITSRRRLVLLGLWGTYFCCLSVVQSEAPWLYIGMGIWMITNLGALQLPQPEPDLEQEGS